MAMLRLMVRIELTRLRGLRLIILINKIGIIVKYS